MVKMLNGQLLVEKIGEGGWAEVWRAKFKDHWCAVKIYKDKNKIKMLRAESLAQHALAGTEHPEARSFARIHALNVNHDPPYIRMDLVQGKDLSKWTTPVPPRRTWLLAQSLLQALAYAHRMGHVHGDLSPSNIVVENWDDNECKIKLIDTGFGLSLLEDLPELELSLEFSHHQQSMAGGVAKYRYYPPERFKTDFLEYEMLRKSCDMYSVGKIIIECFTGSPEAQISAIQDSGLISLDQAQWLSNMVHFDWTRRFKQGEKALWELNQIWSPPEPKKEAAPVASPGEKGTALLGESWHQDRRDLERNEAPFDWSKLNFSSLSFDGTGFAYAVVLLLAFIVLYELVTPHSPHRKLRKHLKKHNHSQKNEGKYRQRRPRQHSSNRNKVRRVPRQRENNRPSSPKPRPHHHNSNSRRSSSNQPSMSQSIWYHPHVEMKSNYYSSPLRQVATSIKDTTVAALDEKGTVHLWMRMEPQAFDRLFLKGSRGTKILFSPDGKYFVIGTKRGYLLVYSTRSWTPIKKFKSHSGAVTAMAYSSNGKILVTAGRDNRFTIWRTNRWTKKFSHYDQNREITDIALGRRGQGIALVCQKRNRSSSIVQYTVETWHNYSYSKPPKRLIEFKSHRYPIRSIDVDRRGGYVLTVDEGGVAYQWPLGGRGPSPAGQKKPSYTKKYSASSKYPWARFYRHGVVVLQVSKFSGSRGYWQLVTYPKSRFGYRKNGVIITKLSPTEISDLAFSPDERYLFLVNNQNHLTGYRTTSRSQSGTGSSIGSK